MAEIGYGILKSKKPLPDLPVMILHIIGDYKPLESFISIFADVILVQAEETSSEEEIETLNNNFLRQFPSQWLLFWKDIKSCTGFQSSFCSDCNDAIFGQSIYGSRDNSDTLEEISDSIRNFKCDKRNGFIQEDNYKYQISHSILSIKGDPL